MRVLNKNNFENLCLIEQRRVKEHPSYLFWLNTNNELQIATILNLINVDFVRNEHWNKIYNIQSRNDFKSWLFQEWQKTCLN